MGLKRATLRGTAAMMLLVACAHAGPHAATETSTMSSALRAYITHAWTMLRRDHSTLLQAATDPKQPMGTPARLYISAQEDADAVQELLRTRVPAADLAQIELHTLSADHAVPGDPGLLYLPHPFVVPGGRFNEMYGWDSYFIIRGLLTEGAQTLARNMVDNLLYEVRFYGSVLNANRSYHLSRSQPPFLARLVVLTDDVQHDTAWLAAALPLLEADYHTWETPPHALPELSLARYADRLDGPAPEVLSGQRFADGTTYYDRVRGIFQRQGTDGVPNVYDADHDTLLPHFYAADRAMRESGFDPSWRFGALNSGILEFAPVCLNTLLVAYARDIAEVYRRLQRPGADAWEARAQTRAQAIQALLWDEQAGLFSDYNYATQTQRHYPFLTTFWPMWAGIASQTQAARLVQALPLFEQPGGLQTSTHISGVQWDAPYGWAPLQLMAVEALVRYGYTDDARRIAQKFLSMVETDFARTQVVVEKYDVAQRRSVVHLQAGYAGNEVGFGWTNATLLIFAQFLQPPL